MGFYSERILPHLIDRACSLGQIMRLRAETVPQAFGDVLEVGMGSGINLPFYDPMKVRKVFGLEPSEGMRRKAEPQLKAADVPVEWIGLPGERIPLADASVDTVLLTFTLCTIPGAEEALAEMRRVLRPEGKLLFLEHGASADRSVARWQSRLTPGWKCIAGGCHLNREIDALIQRAGFRIESLNNFYVPKAPKVAGYIYQGVASR